MIRLKLQFYAHSGDLQCIRLILHSNVDHALCLYAYFLRAFLASVTHIKNWGSYIFKRVRRDNLSLSDTSSTSLLLPSVHITYGKLKISWNLILQNWTILTSVWWRWHCAAIDDGCGAVHSFAQFNCCFKSWIFPCRLLSVQTQRMNLSHLKSIRTIIRQRKRLPTTACCPTHPSKRPRYTSFWNMQKLGLSSKVATTICIRVPVDPISHRRVAQSETASW